MAPAPGAERNSGTADARALEMFFEMLLSERGAAAIRYRVTGAILNNFKTRKLHADLIWAAPTAPISALI